MWYVYLLLNRMAITITMTYDISMENTSNVNTDGDGEILIYSCCATEIFHATYENKCNSI